MRKFIQLGTFLFTIITMQGFAGDKVDQQLDVNGASHVSIDNLRGKVIVTGWDQNSVSVNGEIDDEAKEFIFEKKDDEIIIKVVMPRHMNGGWNKDGSNLNIQLPKNIRVDFTGVSSDVELHDLHKSTQAKTVSGDIKVSELSQHIELTTVSGEINSRNLAGKITLSTVSGRIVDKQSQGHLNLKAVSGDLNTHSTANEVSVNTVSGEIELNLAEIDELLISTVSGDVDGRLSLNNNGLIKMSSVSGDLDLTFENDVQASFRLKANAGGDLVNRITEDKAIQAKYGPSSKLSFETGNANASVKASTVSGRIKVSKK